MLPCKTKEIMITGKFKIKLFFQKQGKEKHNRLASFICFFIFPLKIKRPKGGKQERK